MIRPLRGKVLIKVTEADEVTKGGIVIPDSAKETPAQGEVISVGPDRILDNGTTVRMSVKEGDTVLYKKWTGSDVKDPEGNEFKILSEEDILATII